MVIGIVGKIGSGKSEVVKYLQEDYGAVAFSCDEVAKEIMIEENVEIEPTCDVFSNNNLLEKFRTTIHPFVFSRIYENINIIYNFFEKREYNLQNLDTILRQIKNKLNLNIFSNRMNENNFLEICNLLNKMNKNIIISDNLSPKNNNQRIDNNFNNYNNLNNIVDNNELLNILIIVESALPSDDMFKICDKTIYVDSRYESRVSRLKKSRNYLDDKIKLIYDSQSYYEKFYSRADYKIMNDGNKVDLRNKVKEVIDEICFACK